MDTHVVHDAIQARLSRSNSLETKMSVEANLHKRSTATYKPHWPQWLPRRVRFEVCWMSTASPSRMLRASLSPASSDSRRATFSAYGSALATHIFSNFARYSMIASSSAWAPSRSELVSDAALARSEASLFLYFTSCDFIVLVISFSLLTLSCEDAAIDSVVSISARPLVKSLSTTSSMPMIPEPAPSADEWLFPSEA